MAVTDRLNNLITELDETEDFTYEDYFSVMDIPKSDKEKRKDFAEKVEDVMLFIFALHLLMKQNGMENADYVKNQLETRYKAVISGYITIDEYIDDYVDSFTDEVIDTMNKHIRPDIDESEKTERQKTDEEYYTSDLRAMYIAANEANSVFNYDDYKQAIESEKTLKRWITEQDNRVRKTHKEVNGLSVPIDRPFVVGDSLLLFPHDISLGASMKEIANCRCTVEYY